MIEVAKTARGVAKLATPEEIEKENSYHFLITDGGSLLQTDSGFFLVPNVGNFGYTNPNLHRRIETDPDISPRPLDPDRKLEYTAPLSTETQPIWTQSDEELLASRYGTWQQMEDEGGQPLDPSYVDYPFVYYDEDGEPYKQSVVLGVWDGINSYRTTTTHTHDEESTTCEIP